MPEQHETAVPQLQPTIRAEHRNRLIQLVECRLLDPDQRVPRTGQAQLFGPILEYQQQPAVRSRLANDAQHRAVGKRPDFLMCGSGVGEPAPPLSPPTRKVRTFRQAARLLHLLQHPVEMRPVGKKCVINPEQITKGPIVIAENLIGAEQRNTGRQPVERFGLRRLRPIAFGPGFVARRHIKGEPGNTRCGQGHVMDFEHPARIADDYRFIAHLVLTQVSRPLRGDARHRRQRILRQLGPIFDHRFGRCAVHRRHIGRIGIADPEIGIAAPDRQRCRFDQRPCRRQFRPQGLLVRPQAGNFRLVFAGIAKPDDDAPFPRHLNRSGPPPRQQNLAGANRPNQPSEYLPRQRRCCRIAAQPGKILRRKTGAAIGLQIGKDRQPLVDVQPTAQRIGRRHRPICPDDQIGPRNRRQQTAQALPPGLGNPRLEPGTRAPDDRPNRKGQPGRRNQRDRSAAGLRIGGP